MNTLIGFIFGSLLAAAVGSLLLTGLLYTPAMEWIGSNSSASDVFILGSFSEGFRFFLTTLAAMFLRVVAWVIVCWGSIYFLVGRFWKWSVARILLTGGVAGIMAGTIVYFAFIIPFDWPELKSTSFNNMIPFLVFSFRCAIIGGALGTVMSAIFCFVGARAR